MHRYNTLCDKGKDFPALIINAKPFLYIRKVCNFVQITEMDFEIMKMPVMKNYDEVLTILFGDYMTPVWGTQEHDYPFYKKQQELLEAYLKTNESDH